MVKVKKESLKFCFKWLLKELREKGSYTPKTRIYARMVDKVSSIHLQMVCRPSPSFQTSYFLDRHQLTSASLTRFTPASMTAHKAGHQKEWLQRVKVNFVLLRWLRLGWALTVHILGRSYFTQIYSEEYTSVSSYMFYLSISWEILSYLKRIVSCQQKCDNSKCEILFSQMPTTRLKFWHSIRPE